MRQKVYDFDARLKPAPCEPCLRRKSAPCTHRMAGTQLAQLFVQRALHWGRGPVHLTVAFRSRLRWEPMLRPPRPLALRRLPRVGSGLAMHSKVNAKRAREGWVADGTSI